MKTLKEYIKEVEEKGIAIGHFNISNIEALHGIYNAAKKLSVPVIIGVSEGEEEFIGRNEVAVLIKEIRERDNYPIFLNADHHYSFESVKNALDAGYDAAIIDAVKLPLEENIALTKKCVEYAKELSKKEGREILIEAELGFIGQSSKLLEAIPEGVSEATMTKPEDAKYFVEQTGINLIAPSVGNIHGMVKGGNPRLDIKRIKEVREACGIPMVPYDGGFFVSLPMDKPGEVVDELMKEGIFLVPLAKGIRVAVSAVSLKKLPAIPEKIKAAVDRVSNEKQ